VERQDRCVPVSWQPALVVDLLANRALNMHYLLRKTGVFYEDIFVADRRISPAQWAQLCLNLSQCREGEQWAFALGQRLLPGNFGALSSALQYAPDLRAVLETLETYGSALFPLLSFRCVEAGDELHVWLEDAHGFLLGQSSSARSIARFMTDMAMTAIVTLTTWLFGRILPWRCRFAHAGPERLEAYRAYLAVPCEFDANTTLMAIHTDQLHRPGIRSVNTLYRRARVELAQDPDGPLPTFLETTRREMRADVRELPSLEALARRIRVSPATLKRKFQRHDSRFQKECDRVRRLEAMHLADWMGYTEHQLSEHFCYYDVSNFRRSLRRWVMLG